VPIVDPKIGDRSNVASVEYVMQLLNWRIVMFDLYSLCHGLVRLQENMTNRQWEDRKGDESNGTCEEYDSFMQSLKAECKRLRTCRL
jgi:hypothetical protein